MPAFGDDESVSVAEIKGLRVGVPADWFFDVCDSDVRLAMEGWPGGPPHYPALGCTPEMWRAMFRELYRRRSWRE